jgi:guanylate kinase
MEYLYSKTLIMLVAPTAMGKSAIMNELAARDDRFSRVQSFTTRPPRDNDEPEQYFYLDDKSLAIARDEGNVVTEITFPTTGYVYGTLESSYNGEYCLLDTLANSVETYRDLTFGHTRTVSIASPAGSWRQRFLGRYPYESLEAVQRLEEAKLSIQWSLEQTQNHTWLINDGALDEAAGKLRDISLGGDGENGSEMAQAQLHIIENGIWS